MRRRCVGGWGGVIFRKCQVPADGAKMGVDIINPVGLGKPSLHHTSNQIISPISLGENVGYDVKTVVKCACVRGERRARERKSNLVEVWHASVHQS